jgi:hypothetical protein
MTPGKHHPQIQYGEEPPADRAPASNVNPDAGDYAITADPDERAATDEAAAWSWREFPYYARRYGERGWRFSLSDSGWLPTLCALPPDAAQHQLTWLQDLLVARGMPSYLFEKHLEVLDVELARRCPARRANHATIARGAAAARRERLRVLPENTFAQLATSFDAAIDHVSERVPNFGVVLVSAAIDEACGRAKALSSVTAWACDRRQFPAPWVRAVHHAIDRVQIAIQTVG